MALWVMRHISDVSDVSDAVFRQTVLIYTGYLICPCSLGTGALKILSNSNWNVSKTLTYWSWCAQNLTHKHSQKALKSTKKHRISIRKVARMRSLKRNLGVKWIVVLRVKSEFWKWEWLLEVMALTGHRTNRIYSYPDRNNVQIGIEVHIMLFYVTYLCFSCNF